MSEREFFTRAGQNLLALSWHANGLYYGVGVEIDLWLHAGFDVVVNGSRADLPQARRAMSRRCCPFVYRFRRRSCASAENRGRENASEINARLARAARYTPRIVLRSIMTAACASRLDRLLTLIHQKEKHHACW
ncbi:ribose 1,5-bisphosphokinase [Shigella sonnei]